MTSEKPNKDVWFIVRVDPSGYTNSIEKCFSDYADVEKYVRNNYLNDYGTDASTSIFVAKATHMVHYPKVDLVLDPIE